jgi:hypothetical protein
MFSAIFLNEVWSSARDEVSGTDRKQEGWEQGMWIERATVGELSTRPLGANPEPPSTTVEKGNGTSRESESPTYLGLGLPL